MINSLKTFFSYKTFLNEEINNNSNLCRLEGEKLKSFQNCLLKMYVDLKNACEPLGITPFLVGGSALGQVRHGGFIPWDDDLDIGMKRKDYNIFINEFDSMLSDKYILRAPSYHEGAVNRFAQMYKKDSVYKSIGNDDLFVPDKIFIDIFPVDNVPDKKIQRNVKGAWCTILMAIAGQVNFYYHERKELKPIMKKSFKGYVNYILKTITGLFFSFYSPDMWFRLVDLNVRYRNEQTKFCTIAVGRKHYFGEICLTTTFFPIIKRKFENIEVWTLAQPDLYLRNLYGNYMSIPPFEKRESHFIVNLELGDCK